MRGPVKGPRAPGLRDGGVRPRGPRRRARTARAPPLLAPFHERAPPRKRTVVVVDHQAELGGSRGEDVVLALAAAPRAPPSPQRDRGRYRNPGVRRRHLVRNLAFPLRMGLVAHISAHLAARFEFAETENGNCGWVASVALFSYGVSQKRRIRGRKWWGWGGIS